MVLEEFYMISQVVAAFAVVASLVFVGLQMKQSDSTQQALMHQARTDRHIQIGLTVMDPSHREMFRNLEGDARKLSEKEVDYLMGVSRIGMLNSEDVVWQYKRGLLDDTVLEDQKRTIANMLELPAQRAIWRMIKQRFDPEFIEFVDEIEKITPLSNIPEDRTQRYLHALDQVEREVSGQTNT